MKASTCMKSATVEAVITRADGSRVNLGQVAYWHRNPLRRWAWRIRRALRNLVNSSALER